MTTPSTWKLQKPSEKEKAESMNSRHRYLFAKSLLFFFFLAFAKWGTAQTTPTFQAQPNEEHYVLIILSEKWADAHEIAGQVARYNQALPNAKKPKKLQLYRIPFLGKQPVITLMGFPDQRTAEAYCRQLQENKPDFLQMNTVEKIWPIALSNFNEMLRQQSAAKYEAFLKNHYTF